MFDTNPITVVIMERRKALAILLMVVVIAVPLSLGLIYIHDNPGDVTPISSINSGIRIYARFALELEPFR